MPNRTVRAGAIALPIAQLFRDPVLRAVFGAAERDFGAAPAVVERQPRPRADGGAAAVRNVVEALHG